MQDPSKFDSENGLAMQPAATTTTLSPNGTQPAPSNNNRSSLSKDSITETESQS